MTIYVYRCKKCKREFEVVQSMKEDALTSHSQTTEGHKGLKKPCEGEISRVIQPVAVIFKGSGWTPKRSESMKKVDAALNYMGIEQEDDGWSKGD